MNPDTINQAKEAIIKARVALVMSHPFFGALALRLKPVADPTCKTMWTNGVHLGYNPAYVMSMTPHEVQGTICHEVLHCANGHIWRRDARHPKKWNIACDYAIDPIVEDAGMVQKDKLINPAWKGKASEEIYTLLPDAPDGGGNQPSQGSGDQGDGTSDGNDPGEGDYGPGAVRDGDRQTAAEMESDWKVATIQAAQVAKAQGKLPASLELFIGEITRPKIDWKSELRRFIQQAARNDYSWKRPNPRYMASGLYLPSLHSEQMPAIVVAVDTSGSIGHAELNAFASEINGIADEARPETIHVVYCDAKVAHVDKFEAGEQIVINPKGGGGTDFAPVFEYVAEQGIEPACLIYLTDLCGSFPRQAPDYPTLWVSTERDMEVPFGETLPLEINR